LLCDLANGNHDRPALCTNAGIHGCWPTLQQRLRISVKHLAVFSAISSRASEKHLRQFHLPETGNPEFLLHWPAFFSLLRQRNVSSKKVLGAEVLMKRTLKIVGIVILVLIVIVVVLPFVINVNTFRPKIESELTNALGRKVTVGNLGLSLISGSLTADNIAIADDPSFSNSPFIQAQKLNVGVEMIPLIFSKTLHVTDLTLSQPQVSLLRNRSGKWNFSTLGNAAPAKKTGEAPPSSAGQPPAPPVGKSAGKEPTSANGNAAPTGNTSGNPSSEPSIEQNLSGQ